MSEFDSNPGIAERQEPCVRKGDRFQICPHKIVRGMQQTLFRLYDLPGE
jgi:hypothetical protein